MEVENCVILYLDILGYKNLINNCDQNPKKENIYLKKIHQLMSNLSTFLNQYATTIDKTYPDDSLKLSRFKSFIFSDNILFFAPYQNDADMINLYMNLLYGLSQFLIQSVDDELYFRGAITKGNLYYDDKLHFIFGSGLVRAYELESTNAKYPRIIIDDFLKPVPFLVGLKQDEDEMWYFDYLALGFSIMCPQQNGKRSNLEYFTTCLEKNKTAIQHALLRYKSTEYIYKKYSWLASYHNKFCQYYKFDNLSIDI